MSLSSFDKDYDRYKESLLSKEYLKAKLYLLNSINSNISIKNLTNIAKLYHELGDLYSTTKELNRAIKYYKLSLKINSLKNSPSKEIEFKNIHSLSKSYTKIGEIFQAFKLLNRALEIASIEYGKNSKEVKTLNTKIATLHSRLIEPSI
jgi:tetratricopeptide (TPR) repeat protein